MSETELRLLGSVEVKGDEGVVAMHARPARVLLALWAAGHQRVSLDELVEKCFDDDERPDDPIPALRTAVRRVRRALGDESVQTRSGGYELDLSAITVDVDHFDAAIRSGRAATDPVAAITHFREALGLWRGRPFDGHDVEWLDLERVRLEEAHLVALESWHDAHLRNGTVTEIIPSMEATASANLLRGRFQRQLMQGFFASDRQADALRAFQRHRDALAEAGLEPSDDTVELERRIAVADPSLLAAEEGRALRGYRVLERLGEGAFSIVYRGAQPSVGRDVAIKQIRAELANRPEFIRRFETEAHLVARLEHPHIVPLFDYWREPDSAYLVMRLLKGGNLETALQRGPWDLDKTLKMVGQVGGALSVAHRAGVVHRDVKPANILLDDDGNAYLTDFGIALEAAESADPDAALSAGSPAYASPEQLRREPVGPSADVHGLAIATYEALAGRLPFPDEPTQAALLRRQLHDPIPPLRDTRGDLPAAVDSVLSRATAKSPMDRFQSVEEFIAALEAAASPGETSPSRVGLGTMVKSEARNPYKGLRAFDEADARDFTGRDRLVDQLLETLAGNRLIAVVGPSGSGKSSVVRAGLLPALRSGSIAASADWFITTMVPGSDPFEELETALLRIAAERPSNLLAVLRDGPRGIARGIVHALPEDDSQILLMIDQFEELFTLADPTATKRFLDALAAAVTQERSRLRVVVTLRADFYDRPLRHDAIGRLVKDATVAVLPLAPDELEHAIVDPAHAVGAEFEPGLVSEIVADVADQPGALPLLQYALTELYEAEVSGLMTRDAYQKLGGVAGALGRRAEELYQAASAQEQSVLRRIFGRLVLLGEGTEDTRRRALRTELGDAEEVSSVVEAFGAARLLSFDHDRVTREPTVEVAHEALLREWPRLRGWLDEDRDGLRILRHLNGTANEWDAAGRPESELYRGGRLEAAEELAAASPESLRPVEFQFVDAAVARREVDAVAQRRTNRRLRRLLTGVGVVAVIALIAGIFAFVQRSRAQENQALAESRADAAVAAEEGERQARTDSETRRMIADGARLAETDPQLALLLAAEAHNRAPGDESLGGLQRVLTRTGNFLGFLSTDPGFDSLAFDDEGTLLAGASGELWEFASDGTAVRRGSTEEGRTDLLLPDAGFFLTTTGAISTVRAIATGSVVHELRHREMPVRVIGAGSTVAALFEGGWVETWDLDSGELMALVHAVPETTFGEINESIEPELRMTQFDYVPLVAQGMPIALTSDGSVVAIGGSFLIRFLDASTGERSRDDLLIRIERADGESNSVATNALGFLDDDRVVFGASPTFSYSFDVETSDFLSWGQSQGLTGQNPTVATDGAVELKQSGQVVFLSDVGDFAAGATITTSVSNGTSVALSRDEGQLALASPQGIALFSLDAAGLLNEALPRRDAVSLSIDRSGERVVFDHFFGLPYSHVFRRATDGSWDESRVDFEVGASHFIPAQRPGFERVYDLAATGLGETLVLDSVTGDVVGRHINATAGTRLTETTVAQMLDSGEMVVTSLPEGQLLSTHDELTDIAGRVIATGSLYEAVAHDPTRSRLFVVVKGGYIGTWDTDSWAFTEFAVDSDITALAFSPAGDVAVSADGSGSLQIRDPETLEPLGAPLIGHTAEVGVFEKGISFFGDSYMVTLGQDQTIRLWNIETREQIGDALRTTGGAAFDAQSEANMVATATDESFLLWNYDIESWPGIACQAAGRNLTLAEWQQFGPAGEPYRATCPQWPVAEGS